MQMMIENFNDDDDDDVTVELMVLMNKSKKVEDIFWNLFSFYMS